MNFERDQWDKWREITDKIVSNPNYRYAHPKSYLLLKMVKFAQQMMAKHNTTYHLMKEKIDD